MAVLYVTEFSNLMSTAYQSSMGQMAQAPALVQQVVAIGAGSVQSAAFNASTSFIRVHTDSICSITLGANPTVTALMMRMAAGQTEYFGVVSGHKIAVIANT